MSLKMLCKEIWGYLLALPDPERQDYLRVYELTCTIVRLHMNFLVNPRKEARARLQDLYGTLKRQSEFRRNNPSS